MPARDHFYTTSQTERDNAFVQFGYIDEGIACYAYGEQISGTIPFYRLFNQKTGDHFYTTSRAEADNAIAKFGYTDERIACYVCGPQIPFYRLLKSG
ncbi:MAG: hypothetical protein B6I38_03775 [Anaerolineaceae bacterium 4572_5.1]|nr:MAG: hypothetical protein B6I38_03775 [Anaerolineaceae bacterium 4572_5.1]